MLVYGRNVAMEYLKKNKKVEKAILQENFGDKMLISLIEKRKLKVKTLRKCEIDDLCFGNHQGIILDVPDYQYYDLSSIGDESKVVILDHIMDPHNLGAIIRTCEAAGISSIIIPKDRQVQVTGTVVKTSAGTVDSVKIIRVSNISMAINKLKENGFWIVGTSLSVDSVDYRSIDYSGKIGLVIGNEGRGMSKLVTNNCDFIAHIPMYGTTNSLNASVASGIMIYEMIRNRK